MLEFQRPLAGFAHTWFDSENVGDSPQGLVVKMQSVRKEFTGPHPYHAQPRYKDWWELWAHLAKYYHQITHKMCFSMWTKKCSKKTNWCWSTRTRCTCCRCEVSVLTILRVRVQAHFQSLSMAVTWTSIFLLNPFFTVLSMLSGSFCSPQSSLSPHFWLLRVSDVPGITVRASSKPECPGPALASPTLLLSSLHLLRSQHTDTLTAEGKERL